MKLKEFISASCLLGSDYVWLVNPVLISLAIMGLEGYTLKNNEDTQHL